ncbi:MAG: tRNA (adenosine(37)-N6)-dimethylallyltransferase MiaA [Bacteroidales bacterium]|nr:tRNA (adenosine(37)-N6)-dimethylallyltransferase MiaA [Bacteroidales bacterium]
MADRKYQYDMVVITGPTASGKTSLAAELAYRIGGEIISADSRQVYRRMNLGTGKDYDDYIVEGVAVPYHLVDIVDVGYKYNLFEFQRDFIRVYNDLKNRDVYPVVCGGSGMYIDSIVSGYKLVEVPPDQELRKELEKKSMGELTEILASYKPLHNTTDIDTKKRVIRAIEIEHFTRENYAVSTNMPQLKSLIVGVKFDRDERRRRITERLKKRMELGMVDEVKRLLDSGIDPETLIYYGLEYKYITMYLTGAMSYEEMMHDLEIAIHQFAKRQMTWFRGMERKGTRIHWLDGKSPMKEKLSVVMKLLQAQND